MEKESWRIVQAKKCKKWKIFDTYLHLQQGK